MALLTVVLAKQWIEKKKLKPSVGIGTKIKSNPTYFILPFYKSGER
jgi:hypothetical protein